LEECNPEDPAPVKLSCLFANGFPALALDKRVVTWENGLHLNHCSFRTVDRHHIHSVTTWQRKGIAAKGAGALNHPQQRIKGVSR
jgi:hypothetical protein